MRKRKTTIPQFKSIEEESDFWDKHSLTEFDTRTVTMAEAIEESRERAQKCTMTLELSAQDLERLKKVADERGVNYQSLAAELLHKELAQTTN